MLSKSQSQGKVKYGHQMKMVFEYRATHVLWVISEAEFDGDIRFFFKFCLRKGQCQVKLGQIFKFETFYRNTPILSFSED